MEDEKQYKWLGFAQDYLSCAELLCWEMLEQHYVYDPFDTGKQWARFPMHNIFIPMMFNLKHGIELFLKMLRMVMVDKIEKGKNGHDIAYLFSLLKKEVDSDYIQDELHNTDTTTKNPGDKINLEIATENVKNLVSNFSEIERVTMKYYEGEILLKSVPNKSLSFVDSDNTMFKYPENSSGQNIEYDTFVEKITKEDVKVILADVRILLNTLNLSWV